MSHWYHNIEDEQVGVVEGYVDNHPSATFKIDFADESYTGSFFTMYESENGGELDIEMDDPRYDEFYQIVFELPDRTGPGRRRYNEYLSIDYRDFPVRITDIDRNVVVYPKQDE